MALHLDLDVGDILVVPTDSGAQIRITEKTGRRTRVAVDSAKPVHVLRARDASSTHISDVPRPRPTPTGDPQKPKS
jgi:hypothetical protein